MSQGVALNGLENPERDTEDYHRYIDWLERARKWLVLCSCLCAAAGLAANLAGIALSLYPKENAAATTPTALVCILMLCVAISISDNRSKYYGFSLTAVLIAVLGASLPHAFEAFDRDYLVLPQFGGQVGQDTSLVIILLAISVISRYRASLVGLAAGLAAFALIMNAVIGQTYGLPFFDGEMALPTLLSLIFAMAASASLYLHRPIIRVMFMSGSIGFRTRVMMAVGFIAPWGCGMLLYRWYGVPERDYPVEATLISAIIWIMLAVTLASGFYHERADKERRAAERRLAQLALTDPLTELPNRAALNAKLADHWTRFHRFQVPIAIVLIDLDHFKAINDTFGHDIGDTVLRAVRNALSPYLREEDVIARWGGEEFICVLKNTELHHLQRITERLRRAMLSISDLPSLSHGKGRVNVSASFGVSTLQKGDKGYAAAIKRADEALYIAKRNGRNRVVFDAALRPTLLQTVKARSALRA